MSVKTIFKDCKIVTAGTYATGTADVKLPTTGVDTKGYDVAEFVLHLATIAAGAVTTAKVQQSDDTTDGNFSDLEGTSQTIADDDDNGVKIFTIVKPTKRYLRLYVDKDASNAVGASALCYLHGAEIKPVTQASDVAGELHVTPAEGTA